MLIIPCGAKKLVSDVPVQAWSLYLGAYYRVLFEKAVTLDPDVRIMSAGYGLLRLNDMVMPYNRKMDKNRALQFKASYHKLEADSFLPKMYRVAVPKVRQLIPDGIGGMGCIMQYVSNMPPGQFKLLEMQDGDLRELVEG